jgi:16S rRNA (uracil1498-N3)-methyltransferase
MPRYDFRNPRLFVDHALASGVEVELDSNQASYLANVMRLKAGDKVLLFNGREGEWRGTLGGKRLRSVTVDEQSRAQQAAGDLHLLFAPLKHARLDYMIQKAVEMGVSRLVPVITQHTQVSRVNADRMRANAIEAAEQCGVLTLPEISEPVNFDKINFQSGRTYVFCDEHAEVKDPVEALAALRAKPSALVPLSAETTMQLAVLIGPEGGFSEEERAALIERKNVVRVAIGPRILRADTAAVAALAVVQAVLGDWRNSSAKQ